MKLFISFLWHLPLVRDVLNSFTSHKKMNQGIIFIECKFVYECIIVITVTDGNRFERFKGESLNFKSDSVKSSDEIDGIVYRLEVYN